MRVRAIRAAAIVVVAGALLVLLDYLAPLQWPTVFAYIGLTVALIGLICIVWPLRFLGVTRRWQGCLAGFLGVAILTAGLVWPVSVVARTTRVTQLDEFLPLYHFHERHSSRVHATPARATEGAWTVTFDDIGAFETLGRIRNLALGDFRRPVPPRNPVPILQLMSNPSGGGFFPLVRTEREYVFGMAGRPWVNSAPTRLTPGEFRTWRTPNSVLIAFNFLIEDEGNGWSRVSTETRVLATDDAARRTMARYWRLIYPGSGLLRRSMLNAIRVRAERGT
jgi:hypothetical protein